MAGNNPKPWEARPTGRSAEAAKSRRRVLIVCEDSKSSCLYFGAFGIDRERAEVMTVGTGKNTDSLMEEAIDRKKSAEKRHEPYNQVWSVFDRDSFPLANYSRAFELASANGIKVAWANEAFELWYLIHYNYHVSGISRDDYGQKLAACGIADYSKADAGTYSKVLAHQETAIRNAKKLEKHWREMGKRFPERENPSTGVHKLVEFLNELRELGPVAPED
jgi:hypothetical protein